MTDQEAPVRYRYRGSGPMRKAIEERAVRELCICGRHYWRWPGSPVEHCAHCLAAHPELRPQKGITRLE